MTRLALVAALAVGLAALRPGVSRGLAAPPAFRADAPVLLVPGWSETGRALAALRIRLLAAGWSGDEVVTTSFLEPLGDNRAHASELSDTIDAVLARTGAQRLDIVAHSMGGLATRAYLLEHGGGKVRRVIFLATPHHGTLAAYAAFGPGREDMLPDSPFLAWLNGAPPVPEGVEAMTVRTPLDTHVLPNESAMLEGVEDHVVCCPTHAGLLDNLGVFRLIRRFLDDGPRAAPGSGGR